MSLKKIFFSTLLVAIAVSNTSCAKSGDIKEVATVAANQQLEQSSELNSSSISKPTSEVVTSEPATVITEGPSEITLDEPSSSEVVTSVEETAMETSTFAVEINTEFIATEAPTEKKVAVATETSTPSVNVPMSSSEVSTASVNVPTSSSEVQTPSPKDEVAEKGMYAMCIQKTVVTLPNGDLYDLYEGQQVQILALGEEVTIRWYSETAKVEANCLEVYPENFKPDFAKGQWAGVITKLVPAV